MEFGKRKGLTWLKCLICNTLSLVDWLNFKLNDFVCYLFYALGFLGQFPALPGHPAVLVTGASSGIGKAITLGLVNQGYTVFATIRKEIDGEALAANLSEDRKNKLHLLTLDLRETALIEQAVSIVIAKTDALGIPLVGLINNAGYGILRPLEATSSANMEQLIRTNFLGPVELTRLLIPTLRKNQGRIVNMGSAIYYTRAPWDGAYGASKASLRHWNDTLRLELAASKISVSLIESGIIDTPGIDKTTTDFHNYAKNSHQLSTKPMQQMVDNLHIWSISTEHVVQAVWHSLQSPFPKNRYLVGWDARAIALVDQIIPTFFKDFIIHRLFY